MAYSEELVDTVWQSARALSEFDAAVWRRDACGAWIRREHYGNARSDFGWNIVNVSAGEPDVPANLRALHHANTYDRANHSLKCHVRADDTGTPASAHSREPRNRTI